MEVQGIEKAFYGYNDIRLRSALGYLALDEYYIRWMIEHGKEAEPSILHPAERFKRSGSIPTDWTLSRSTSLHAINGTTVS